MTVVGLNDLLPNNQKVISILTASELLFAYELGKYAQLFLNKILVLSDVTIAKELLNGEHFSFVVTNGLDVGFAPKRESLVDYSKFRKNFFEGIVECVVFKRVTEDEIVFDFEYDTIANKIFNSSYNSSTAYVSLIAYIIIKSIQNGTRIPKLIIDHINRSPKKLEYVDLLDLQLNGNKLLHDLIEIKTFEGKDRHTPDFETFVIQNRQKGFMNVNSTIKAKYNYLKKNFEPGDVILLYLRLFTGKNDKIGKLQSCYPAVIENFNKSSLKLKYYPKIQTKLTEHNHLVKLNVALDAHAAREGIKKEDQYLRYYEEYYFFGRTEEFKLTEIGVDMSTYIEQIFFIKPIDDDGSMQYLSTGEGIKEQWLSTIDTIFAVFEDQRVSYNKEKFLREYFVSQNRHPIYQSVIVEE